MVFNYCKWVELLSIIVNYLIKQWIDLWSNQCQVGVSLNKLLKVHSLVGQFLSLDTPMGECQARFYINDTEVTDECSKSYTNI